MQSLRLKQRVLEVHSKVFKRRSTIDPTSPNGQRPTQNYEQEQSSPKNTKRTPSIVSSVSSELSRNNKNNAKKRKDDATTCEVAKQDGDRSEGKRISWRMKKGCDIEADIKTLVDKKDEQLSVSASRSSPMIDTPITPKDRNLKLHTSDLNDDHDPLQPLTTTSTPLGTPELFPHTILSNLKSTEIIHTEAQPSPSPSSSNTGTHITPTASPVVPPLPIIPTTLTSLQESDRDISPVSPSFIPQQISTSSAGSPPPLRRPSQFVRRQSLLPATETNLIHNLLNPDRPPLVERVSSSGEFQAYTDNCLSQNNTEPLGMVTRKIWVKRPNASPTAIAVAEGDLVDDARDLILRKYQNSLGRSYDAPDIHLKILPRMNTRPRDHERRGHLIERILNPDESILRTIDDYYPNGQSAEEALIIEIPQRRTPRPSPSQAQNYTYGAADHMGMEGSDYFSVPVSSSHSQGTPAGTSSTHNQPSMAVLTTGQVPQIPGSPGRRSHTRPSMGRRMNTASPTLHSTPVTQGPVMLMPRQNRNRATNSETTNNGQPPPAPLKQQAGFEEKSQKVATPPPARVGSPPNSTKPFKKEKSTSSPLHGDGAVPPIKVLIVEDNVINLRLLEAFMKRLKVRWESAMNGKIAVDKWRAGGFHLVLMDIQLPVMNGLDATKEIRRLERVNKIGSFPHTKLLDGKEEPVPDEVPKNDKLPDSILLRSPVIIVALTASSLQSDRHEAYAAGCNDFLTKPVNFIWLERKVTEWGCMQALIDFDGWKKWKDNADNKSVGNIDGKNPKNKRITAKFSGGGGRKEKLSEENIGKSSSS